MTGIARKPVPPPPVSLRVGSPEHIDALCEIDLDAGDLFSRAGLELNLPADHEFCVAERSRWLRSLESGSALIAVAATGEMVGFAASAIVDGEPYLEQLSVRMKFMRQGIGGMLLLATQSRARLSGARSLWLTTYAHLPWNRPFYERAGFSVVSPAMCGPELRAVVAAEHRWLPFPQERVVMRKVLGESQ